MKIQHAFMFWNLASKYVLRVVIMNVVLSTGERGSNPIFMFFLTILVANERRGELKLCFFRASRQLVLSFSRKIATIER
jgi:hypothetical protein